MVPGRRRKLEPGSDAALAERLKASVRAKVEHPFLKLKRVFGYWKVRYRGLAKNTQRLALLGLGNLLTAERPLVAWRRGYNRLESAERTAADARLHRRGMNSEGTIPHHHRQQEAHIGESWTIKPKTCINRSCSEHPQSDSTIANPRRQRNPDTALRKNRCSFSRTKWLICPRPWRA